MTPSAAYTSARRSFGEELDARARAPHPSRDHGRAVEVSTLRDGLPAWGIHLGASPNHPLVAYKNEASSCRGAHGRDLGGVSPPYLHVDVQLAPPAEVEEAFAPPETRPRRAALSPAGPGRPAFGPRRGAAAATSASAAVAGGGDGDRSGRGEATAPPLHGGTPATNPATVVKTDSERPAATDLLVRGAVKSFKKCHGA